MRGGKPEEGDGSAVGSDNGGEHACGEQQQLTCGLCVDAEVDGVALAELYGVEGLDEEQGETEAEEAQDDEERELLQGDAVEAAHAPQHKALYALG